MERREEDGRTKRIRKVDTRRRLEWSEEEASATECFLLIWTPG